MVISLGGGLALDGLGHLLHLPLISGSALLGGLGLVWWLSRTPQRPAGPSPTDVNGWLQRLERLDQQFISLEQPEGSAVGPSAQNAEAAFSESATLMAPSIATPVLESAGVEPAAAGVALQITPSAPAAVSVPEPSPAARQRAAELAALRQQLQRSGLHLAVVGAVPKEAHWRASFSAALQGAQSLTLHWSRPLPPASADWCWPEPFASSDLLLYCLTPPLMAADLRWLQALPEGQPLQILLQVAADQDPGLQVAELRAQLCDRPDGTPPAVICWQRADDLAAALAPLMHRCSQQAPALRRQRQIRSLEQLHQRWQGQLEDLRRSRFQVLQQRTQWLVAAGVVAAPVPSLDLLVLAVANGLMVREMARLWDCSWNADQLRATAVELAKASLALGVVEWTGQAVAGVIKWHGATWLLGSALQALSAAYLTRVVGRAMADTLARSVGVSEPDLERIRREAPLLVAQAAESERLNWAGFLQQGRQWLAQQAVNGAV